MLVLLPPLALAQVRITAVREWEIPGVHYTRVVGRVVNAQGAPVAGATVQVGPAYQVCETRTNSHGDFEFADVSGDGGLRGTVDPPAGWLPASFEIPDVSGVFQAGEIKLAPAAAVRVVVETAPGQAFRGDLTELSLSVTPKGRAPVPSVTSYASGLFTVEPLPYGKAELEIELKETRYTAQLALDAGSRNRVLVARIPSVKDKDEEGKLEIAEMIRPWAAPPLRTIEGTVRTPDGAPIEGADVGVSGSFGQNRFMWSESAITDAAGRYRVQAPPGGQISIRAGMDWEPSSATDVRIGSALSVEAVVEAPDADAAARASVRWGGPLGWQTLGSGRRWIAPAVGGRGGTVDFVADIPGYLPIFSILAVPGGPDAPPPATLRFRFKGGPVRALAVRSAGKPLAGATVDVVPIEDPACQEPVLPVSYTTGPDGRLQLAGDVAGEYGVIVSAPGHPTRRALWRAGAPLVIDLTPQPAAIEIAGLVRGWKVSVNPEGGEQAVAAFTADRSPATVTVDPAKYRILAFDSAGHLAGTAPVTAVGGRTTRISLGGTRGAEIRVTVPEPDRKWTVSAVPAWSGSSDLTVEADRGVAVLRVASAGRYRLVAGMNGPLWFQRDIEVSEGETVALKIPPLTASIEGVQPPASGREEWLMFLQAAEPGGWDLGCGPVELNADGGFGIGPVPPGRYYAWELAHEPWATRPLSGVPVVLEAGRTAKWKTPAPAAGPPLKIRVTGGDGRRVPYALLYGNVMDSTGWPSPGAVVGPDQLLVRVRNGAAELPHVGAGRLLLRLLSQRGHIYSLAADVTPGRTLEIRLPEERR